jgi:hypothetical protein
VQSVAGQRMLQSVKKKLVSCHVHAPHASGPLR